MATTQNCIYKSVTLAAGEQFTLPPGAEIISATDINSFTSTCPKPTTLDTFVCGSLQWGIQPISGGGGTAPFSVGGINPPDTHCIGVKIGDVKYYSTKSPSNQHLCELVFQLGKGKILLKIKWANFGKFLSLKYFVPGRNPFGFLCNNW